MPTTFEGQCQSCLFYVQNMYTGIYRSLEHQQHAKPAEYTEELSMAMISNFQVFVTLPVRIPVHSKSEGKIRNLTANRFEIGILHTQRTCNASQTMKHKHWHGHMTRHIHVDTSNLKYKT